MKFFKLLLLPLAAMLVLTSCGDNDTSSNDTSSNDTIADIAVNDLQFSTLATALTTAELVETLQGEGPFTVFAPTNAAFDALPAGLLDALLADPTALGNVLQYHVVSGDVRAEQVVTLTEAASLNGTVDVKVIDGTVVLNDRVQVTNTDIIAANGVIHVIDAVLIDGAFPGSIVDALAASPRFSTLFGAVGSIDGLASTLATPIDGANAGFTVFAPDNNAFSMLDAIPSGDALEDILKYHVLGGVVPSSTAIELAGDPTTASQPTALENNNITLSISNNILMINGDSNVIGVDIETENGTIHVIDKVLLP